MRGFTYADAYAFGAEVDASVVLGVDVRFICDVGSLGEDEGGAAADELNA